MTTRPLLFVGLAGVLLGLAIGYLLPGPDALRPEPRSNADAVAELSRLKKEHADLRSDYERLEQSRDLGTRRTALHAPAGTPTKTAPAPIPAAAVGPVVGLDPPISFGAWRNEPAMRTADWPDMGSRARDVVTARKSGIGGGQPAKMAALEKRAMRELRGHLARIKAGQGQLDGHPIVIVNLMASHLSHAGQPLQQAQIEAVEAQGERYEIEAARLRSDLLSRGDVLVTERKVASIKLRKTHVDRIVERVLTQEQWDVLFDPKTKGLLFYDVYQVGGLELERPNSSVYWRHVRADAEKHLRLFLLTEWDVSSAELALIEGTVTEWIDAVMALPKPPGHPSSALHIDEVMPCTEVHTRFQRRVLARLARDSAGEQGIRNHPIFVIFPRLRNPN